MLENFPLDKISVTKNALFFFSRAPTHRSFTFNSKLLYELKHMIHLSKSVCGIFHFQFYLLFIKLYFFFQQKIRGSLALKRHNSFLNKNRKSTHGFPARPEIFNLQQEV